MQLHLKENDCLDNSINTQILDIVDNLKPYVNKAHVEIKIILFFFFKQCLPKGFKHILTSVNVLGIFFVKIKLEMKLCNLKPKSAMCSSSRNKVGGVIFEDLRVSSLA